MILFDSLIGFYLKRRIPRIELFLKQPHEVQQQQFAGLINAARFTEFGKKFEFSSIKSTADFKNRVPVFDYETFKPYIERVMRGEQNITWRSDIYWFAKSSGTTSDKSKFIPVSKEALDECHYRGGKDSMALYLNNFPESKILSTKGLVMGGSHQVSHLNENAKYGDVSAVMLQNMPIIGRVKRVPNLSIALMNDWEEKIDKMARATMVEDVGYIAGVPTWTIVLLNHLFETGNTKNIFNIWPNLELYLHGGVSFKPYREQFKKLIPSDKMHYMEIYNASEGFLGIQNDLKTDDLLLMLDYGIYYEFIPLEEIEKENPRALDLHEVELNKNYALLISTNSGLWRYQIGDTIRFTSLSPYKIQIAGRVKHFINAFGEEVMVDNTDRAIAVACEKTNSTVKDYTVAPIYLDDKGKGGHEWLIEFDHPPADLHEFTVLLDEELKKINSDYEAKRFKDIALQLPVVHSLAAGVFFNWLKSKGKLGGQNKVPRLSNERKYLDDILLFVRQNS